MTCLIRMLLKMYLPKKQSWLLDENWNMIFSMIFLFFSTPIYIVKNNGELKHILSKIFHFSLPQYCQDLRRIENSFMNLYNLIGKKKIKSLGHNPKHGVNSSPPYIILLCPPCNFNTNWIKILHINFSVPLSAIYHAQR